MQARSMFRTVGRILIAVGILASMLLAGAAPSDFANGVVRHALSVAP